MTNPAPAAAPAPAKTASTPLLGWAAVVLLLLAATLGGLLLEQDISIASQAMIYVLAVVLVSYQFGWKESVACAIGAVTALNFFFVPPRLTFQIESREHLIALFTMLLVALVISRLAAGLRQETFVARLNEQRARQLQALATGLAGASTQAEIAAFGDTALHDAFAGPCRLVLADAQGELILGAHIPVNEAEGLTACMREAAVLGPGTGRWPGLNAWYLPLGAREGAREGGMHGAVEVSPASSADDAGREHAQALCTLLAQALLRLKLATAMAAAYSEVERQQVQSTFLAAISHDLRTPLAAVVGAASSLQTQRDKLSPAEQERLLGSIVSEASYLSTVTENTLQLVRLASASQAPSRNWEAMEEIVGTVLARVRQRDPERRIHSSVAEGLPLIKANPVLLAQLLDNLLDNALKYSSGSIDLVVRSNGTQLQLAVKDRGPAIAEDKYAAIFEPYSRSDQSGQRGAGLGLALCRAIAGVHNGSLTVMRRKSGGNTFTLSLPLEAQPPEAGLP